MKDRVPLSKQESSSVHTVQFYEPPAFPASSIADYFCSGIEAEESCSLMIATPEHTHLVKDCLKKRGVDPDALECAGLLISLDALSTLAALRRNGPLSDDSLDDVLGLPIKRASQVSPGGRVRVFGEMANLVANDGDFFTCMQLERFSNRKAARSLRLYCTYSTGCFGDESSSSIACNVCDLHDEIVPFISALHPEGYLTLLLQRSHALQTEIEKRKTVESASRYWEIEYARLFDAHVDHLRDCIEHSLWVKTPTHQFPKAYGDLDQLVERAVQEIFLNCVEACAARRSAPEGSDEWYKRTGELLGYGKLTSLLDALQRLVRRH